MSAWTFDDAFGIAFDENAPPPSVSLADFVDEEQTSWRVNKKAEGTRRAIGFEAMFDRELEECERKFKAESERSAKIYKKIEYAMMEEGMAGRTTGDEKVEQLYEQFHRLDEMGFRRSKQQRRICEIFIRACIRFIYGDELRTDMIRIFRKFQISYIHNMVMCALARRFGKSTITSIFAACYLNIVPDAKIVIYSISRRTSSMLSAKILNFLCMLNGEDWSPEIHNQETIEFVNKAGSRVSLNSYPAAERIRITLI